MTLNASYRGLAPMEAEDAGIFYGREAATIAALDQLRGLAEAAPPRLMAVLGASGAGKSSFMRAGLIPRLKRNDRNFFVLPILRPERAAITGKAGLVSSILGATQALGLKCTRAKVEETIAAGTEATAGLLSDIASTAARASSSAGASATPAIILPIDQAEELFLAEGQEESQLLLALVTALLKADRPKLIALATIRTDSYEKLQLDPALTDVRQLPFNLPALARGAYQRVIEGPAERLAGTNRALKIEPALTAALLADIEEGGAKDALPLLAFTLERLFADHGGDGDLTLAEYEKSKRIAGAIEAAVERALADADGDPGVPRDRTARLALLRRTMIPWLAGIDPDTRMARRQVARFTDIPDEARPLIEHFVEQGLLATDVSSATGERTIEPAHEALLRQWTLLDGWLKEDIAVLATLEGVRRAARDWDANNRDANWLAHAGGRLEDAEAIKSRVDLARRLDASDLDYLDAARAAETGRRDRELEEARKLADEQRKNAEALALVAEKQKIVARRTRIGAIAATALAIVAAGAAGYGFWQVQLANDARVVAESESARAEQEKKNAEAAAALASKEQAKAEASAHKATANETLSLAALSRIARSEGFPALALKLAVAAWPRAGEQHRPAMRRTVASLVEASPDFHERLSLRGHEDAVASAAFSPDGTRIVTASWDRTARVWDAVTGAQLLKLEGHEDGENSVLFSPDDRRIVTASSDKTARVWDAATGAELLKLEGHSNRVWSAAFSSDGARIVTASDDVNARVWDAATGTTLLKLGGHSDAVTSAAFSLDGTRIVTASRDRTARVWDALTGAELLKLEGHTELVTTAAFSPNGEHIVTASADKTARVWDAGTGVELVELDGHQDLVRSAEFSPDGARIVTASYDKTARVWDSATGAELLRLAGHEDTVAWAAFSSDGRRIVTASDDKTARV
ncbi:WD40 repeat domain-containing protein [Mesorhizobium sp.]|uniref:WD40 repeat domain-containing protein n=1 Tax=Mesorhizobium sp. TaxID=1871066 RepID=UPI00257D391F|nr:WD40 repeat domain-containing protein [Mesorhizobium sp.]